MATREDVRRVALSLPRTSEAADHFGFGVLSKGKLRGFAWVWNERIEPRKPRVPNPEVLAVRVASLAEKEELLAAEHPGSQSRRASRSSARWAARKLSARLDRESGAPHRITIRRRRCTMCAAGTSPPSAQGNDGAGQARMGRPDHRVALPP